MKKTLLPFYLLAFILTSCVSTKKVVYFENKDQIDPTLSKTLFDARIMPKDILQIQVFTMTPDAAIPFNLMGALRLSGRQRRQYRVSRLGNPSSGWFE